ncbi:hypothetical protein BU16DRAFT_601894 [Lophium mytilinum]|uniref:F-box domain-containing protein n=1 Tax=Lophium mytilinum TaxID=390894 RepID=A0A6A6R5Z3_9PEZI|nr:hypothetical protein BU16DRAFT_601894 [Lophium mytilinum]
MAKTRHPAVLPKAARRLNVRDMVQAAAQPEDTTVVSDASVVPSTQPRRNPARDSRMSTLDNYAVDQPTPKNARKKIINDKDDVEAPKVKKAKKMTTKAKPAKKKPKAPPAKPQPNKKKGEGELKKQLAELRANVNMMDANREPFSRSGPFRFLDLPREIRDMVYHHVVLPPVSQILGDRPKMRPLNLDAFDYSRLCLSSNRTAILQASKQLREEGRKVLFEESIYQVDLGLKRWCFDVFEPENHDPRAISKGEKYHEQCIEHDNEMWLLDGMAGSPGWNLSEIRKLHITINLRVYTHAQDPEYGYAPYRILEKISVRGLHGMKNLQHLRISILHGYAPPELQAFYDGTAHAPLKVRELMRRLIGSIPKTVKTVRWGLKEEEIMQEYPDRSRRSVSIGSSSFMKSAFKHMQHVRPEVLEPLAKELEVLRGMDAEYYSTPIAS